MDYLIKNLIIQSLIFIKIFHYVILFLCTYFFIFMHVGIYRYNFRNKFFLIIYKPYFTKRNEILIIDILKNIQYLFL